MRSLLAVASLVALPMTYVAYDAQASSGASPAPVTPTTIATNTIVGSSTTNQTIGMPKAAINLTDVPLGSYKSSFAQARVGYLDRCGGVPKSGNPVRTPPWVNTKTNTWNETTKVAVEGSVT